MGLDIEPGRNKIERLTFHTFDGFLDFSNIRKASSIFFGKYNFSRILDIKNTATGLNQLHIQAQFLFKIFRQTSGSRAIVSTTTKSDLAISHLSQLLRFGMLGK